VLLSYIILDMGHSRLEHKPLELCQHSQTETEAFYILRITEPLEESGNL
jgi:hypothetical protein